MLHPVENQQEIKSPLGPPFYKALPDFQWIKKGPPVGTVADPTPIC